MSRSIFIGLLALPVVFGNAANNFASNNVFPVRNQVLIASNIEEHIHLVPFQLSARDEQTEDCLRAGNCKY